MDQGLPFVLVLYGLVLPVWIALSAWAGRRAREWRFTPPWHRRAVPLFRAFFLLTLPFEYVLADRVFLPAVFVTATAATLGWLAWRAIYLLRAPPELPRADSVRYNAAYVANLLSFALACHSFVCLALLINISLPMLLIRERLARRGPEFPGGG